MMATLKNLTKTLLLTAVVFIASQKLTYADGGFPVRPGRLLISPSVSYFFASNEWDSTGVKKPFANNGKFSSVGITLYAEYGLSRRWAVVADLPFVYNRFTQSNGPTATSSGLTDVETGIRYYLANINYIYYFSLQATAMPPL